MMKTVNLIVLTFSIFMSCSVKSQNFNMLDTDQYQNIYINGVKWRNIGNTKGDVSKMETLMKMNFEKEVETEPNDIVYLSNSANGISFHFELNNPNNQADYILYGFEIANPQVSFGILGKTVKVGDTIKKLGNVKISLLDGKKVVLFKGVDVDSESIQIDLDENNKIKLINYTVFY